MAMEAIVDNVYEKMMQDYELIHIQQRKNGAFQSELIPKPSVGACFQHFLCNAMRFITLPKESGSVITIADAGRHTSWPTKLDSVREVVEFLEGRCAEEGVPVPEFQVLLSDVPRHDFNTLCSLVAERKPNYFVSFVPGSVYGRLFPRQSIQFFTSFNWLHLMETIPEEVRDKSSPAYNKNHVYCQTAVSPAVREAFKRHYQKELTDFLKARAEELLPGGVLYFLFGIESTGYWMEVFIKTTEQAWIELVDEGVLTQEQLDDFNFPLIGRTVEEVEEVVMSVSSLYHVKQCEIHVPSDPVGPFFGGQDLESFLIIYCKYFRSTTIGYLLDKYLGREMTDAYFKRWIEVVTRTPSVFNMMMGNAVVCTLVRK